MATRRGPGAEVDRRDIQRNGCWERSTFPRHPGAVPHVASSPQDVGERPLRAASDTATLHLAALGADHSPAVDLAQVTTKERAPGGGPAPWSCR